MKRNPVGLMIYNESLNDVIVSISHPVIKVINIYSVNVPSYLFIDIEIPNELLLDKNNN